MHQLNISKVSACMSIEDYGETYNRYFKKLVKFFKNKAPKRIDHEDLAQETLLQAWNSKDRYQDRGSEQSWIFTIANRVWITAVKYDTAAKRKDSTTSFERQADQDIDAMQDLPPIDGLLTSKLFKSIDELPPDYRHVLILKARGYSNDVCATLLKIKPGVVHYRLGLARKILSGRVRT